MGQCAHVTYAVIEASDIKWAAKEYMANKEQTGGT
jgi:hypothetical protein